MYDTPASTETPFTINADTRIENSIHSGDRVSWFGWFIGIRI